MKSSLKIAEMKREMPKTSGIEEFCSSMGNEHMLKLMEMKKSRTFCDVIITKGNTFVYAHSCILAAFSPFMLNLLMNPPSSDWSINKPLKINISYMTKCKKNSDMNCMTCASRVIDFIYSGKIILELAHLEHLINISNNLEMENLLSLCQKFQVDMKSIEPKQKLVSDIKPIISERSPHYNLKITNSNVILNSGVSTRVSRNCEASSQESSFVNSVIHSSYQNIKALNKSKYLNITIDETAPSIIKREPKQEMVNHDNIAHSIEALDELHLNVESTRDNIIVTLDKQSSGEYHCIKCKLRFCNLKMFEDHKKVFHKRQFICLSCNFTTFKLSYMVFHLFNMNHEENCCSICLYKATDTNSLKLHLQDHKTDFPFKCYDCGNLFKARTEWLRHMPVHNEKESSLCNECGSSFSNSSNLNSHMLCYKSAVVHTCEECGFIANYKSVLERHSLKHKVNKTLSCPVVPCPFSTYSKYNLKQHILSHESEKTFTCELCALKFSQEKNLKRHMRTMHDPLEENFICCRCDYKSKRIDKVKAHCLSFHPEDEEALDFILKQNKERKFVCNDATFNQDKSKKKLIFKQSNYKNCTLKTDTKNNDEKIKSTMKEVTVEKDCDQSQDSVRETLNEIKKTYILSETTGEFNIISENQGEPIPVASVTSTNVLTIGNFREGTGSVTLNETTGILTFNNINSESTGAVFLNESTGELSYINLSKDALKIDVETTALQYRKEVITELNEVTGEIFTVDSEKKITDLNDDDGLFDPFDMDIGNEDSCDGFDDLDGLLFDPIDIETPSDLDLFISRNERETIKGIPHLNEATGELSFDYIESKHSNVWNPNCAFGRSLNLDEETKDSYRLLLNEVTGELS